METKAFKDITLSRLGMGNMRLPIKGKDSEIDYEKAQEIIDYGMSHGINYYDTAYVYHSGESENFLGTAMKKYPRESFCLATKFFIAASEDYKAVFEEQLKKLQTEYIDFYLIHCINDGNYMRYIDGGSIDYFLEQKRLGRIKYLGFSCHSGLDALRTFADHHQWDFAQLQLNYYDWLYSNTKKEYEILTERNIPVVVMEPVRGGRLASLTPETEALLKAAHPDWSMASWAFRWVRTLPNVQVILSGMSNMEQIKDNVSTFSDGTEFTAADEKLLMEVCEKFRRQVVVPCTSCRYCCDGCPAEINIPEFLGVYSSARVDGLGGVKDKAGAVKSSGKPADCVSCGACTGHCPQNIDVPKFMRELADMIN